MAADIGYGGVDIFLFASGMGNYWSFSREHNILNYYQRRYLRILPSYLLFMIIWIPAQIWINGLTFGNAIGNLFMIQTFTGLGYEFNWYISCILLFYLLTPMLVSIIEKNTIVKDCVLVVLIIIASIAFWDTTNGILIASRLPIYIIGMLYMKYQVTTNIQKIVIQIVMLIGWVMLFVCYYGFSDYLWSRGLHWYPFIFITVGLCRIISFVSRKCEANFFLKVVLLPINYLGQRSFEIYLIHIFLLELLKRGRMVKNLPLSNIEIVSVLFGSVFLAEVLARLSKKIVNMCKLGEINEKKDYFHLK